MASTLPTPLECCQTCSDPQEVNVPGVAGNDGAPGADGTNGLNCFTTLVGGETIPTFGNSETIELTAPPGSLWMAATQVVYIQALGYFQVVSTPSDTSVELLNLGYAGNNAGGGAFTAGLHIQPGGLQGAPGASPADALLKANNLNDVADAVASRANLGLKSAALIDTGITTGKLPLVVAPGLTAGQAVFAAAAGIESKSAVLAQAALGLGSMSTQASNAVVITAGAISGVTITGITDLAVADGGTGASSAAAARVNLGVGLLAIATKIANYAALITDSVILVDATALAITVVLPLAASSTGLVITVKKLDVTVNTVTVQGNTGELIDGANTQVISAQWASLSMVCNGTSWFII